MLSVSGLLVGSISALSHNCLLSWYNGLRAFDTIFRLWENAVLIILKNNSLSETATGGFSYDSIAITAESTFGTGLNAFLDIVNLSVGLPKY